MTNPTRQDGVLILNGTADDAVRVEVLYDSETFWLDQRRMAELFGVGVPAIANHLSNIYAAGELSPDSTVSRKEKAQLEGTREVHREIECYNLDPFLQSNEYEVLANAGKVSAAIGRRLAEWHFDRFRVRQDREFVSNFEAEVKRIASKRPGKRKEKS